MNYNTNDLIEDEIVEIEFLGEIDTIDINVTGNRLFYANDILTHNSAVEESEFDHSHIAGGISKINTADYVFGIFTSRSMKERGKYQIQCMKSRSSTGVGQKIDLDYNMDTMRITDSGDDSSNNRQSASDIMNRIKPMSTVADNETINTETGEIVTEYSKVKATVEGTKLKNLLRSLKNN